MGKGFSKKSLFFGFIFIIVLNLFFACSVSAECSETSPEGMLFCEDFEDQENDFDHVACTYGGSDDINCYGDPPHSIVNQNYDSIEGYCSRIRYGYPTNVYPDGTGLFDQWVDVNLSSTGKHYISFWYRLDETYETPIGDNHKIVRFWHSEDSNMDDIMMELHLRADETIPNTFQFGPVVDGIGTGVETGGGNFWDNENPSWHHLEILLKYDNPVDADNGQIIFWIDGIEALNATGKNLVKEGYPSYNRFSIPSNKNSVTDPDYIYIDQVEIWDRMPNSSQLTPECTLGQTRDCDTGLLGICSSGTESCVDGNWSGDCVQDNELIIENCSNGLDDDCDSFVDSEDSDCYEQSEIYFNWTGENGYQYLGHENPHSGGGYFSYLGGNTNGEEGILLDPCSNRDTNEYHYTVLSNEPMAQGSVDGSEYSLKTPYAGHCNDESFSRDTTIIRLNESVDEYYIRWYQKWTGNWMNGDVQQKFTKFYDGYGSPYHSAHFSFGSRSNTWRNYVPNIEDRFDMNGLEHADRLWVYENEEGAGSQYEGVSRAWDDINNGIGEGGTDGQFEFETGKWYCLEIHSKINSDADTSDAVVEAWVDGQKVFEIKDFKFYNNPGDRSETDTFELQHIYYNRETNDDQPTYMDNIVISDNYIGPVNSSNNQNHHPADIDEDGKVSFEEIGIYLNRWLNGEITLNEFLSGINEWRGFD